MAQQRLKSSFIYLANSVNDLRNNWKVLAIVLAPLILASALCLLPEAINVQERVLQNAPPGGQSVMYNHARPVQEPYAPEKEQKPDKYPPWLIQTLYFLSLVILEVTILVTLCTLVRMRAGQREASDMGEAVAILKRSTELAPAFLWVTFLRLTPFIIVFLISQIHFFISSTAVLVLLYSFSIALSAGVVLTYMWLYFAQYALIFSARHSFHALLFSRDLLRKRFFQVSLRITVFLIVWWGYFSFAWTVPDKAANLFFPIGLALTGSISGAIVFFYLLGVVIAYATSAFFTAAGLRLYQDLVPEEAELQTTVPLNDGNLTAAQAAPGA
jgi:hypothetical protein